HPVDARQARAVFAHPAAEPAGPPAAHLEQRPRLLVDVEQEGAESREPFLAEESVHRLCTPLGWAGQIVADGAGSSDGDDGAAADRLPGLIFCTSGLLTIWWTEVMLSERCRVAPYRGRPGWDNGTAPVLLLIRLLDLRPHFLLTRSCR